MSSDPIDDREGIILRLEIVFGSKSNAAIARQLDLKPETIRRYRAQGKISIRLVQRLAARWRISPLWLLLGEGPKMIEPPLASAPTDLLMVEIGRRLDHTGPTGIHVPDHRGDIDTR